VLYLLSIVGALTEQTQDSDDVNDTLKSRFLSSAYLPKLTKARDRSLQHDLHTRCPFHKAHALAIHRPDLVIRTSQHAEVCKRR
jgi:hypothetical protein